MDTGGEVTGRVPDENQTFLRGQSIDGKEFWTSSTLDDCFAWTEVAQVVRCLRRASEDKADEITQHTICAITSLARTQARPATRSLVASTLDD